MYSDKPPTRHLLPRIEAPEPPMSTPSRINLSNRIRATLEEEITSGALVAGSRIDEQALMARFEVSRTPAREALLQLRSTSSTFGDA